MALRSFRARGGVFLLIVAPETSNPAKFDRLHKTEMVIPTIIGARFLLCPTRSAKLERANRPSSVSERSTAIEPLMVRERSGDLQVVASALPASSHPRRC